MLATVALEEAAAAVGLAAALEAAVRQEIQDHLATAAETETTQTVLVVLADHLVVAVAQPESTSVVYPMSR